MLRILFGEPNEDWYYDTAFQSEWLNNDFVKVMIKDIDKSG